MNYSEKRRVNEIVRNCTMEILEDIYKGQGAYNKADVYGWILELNMKIQDGIEKTKDIDNGCLGY